jgi:hypothetical protein
MLLLFESVADAVGYALAYHAALSRERKVCIEARAGIHFGPVSLRPNPPEDVCSWRQADRGGRHRAADGRSDHGHRFGRADAAERGLRAAG